MTFTSVFKHRMALALVLGVLTLLPKTAHCSDADALLRAATEAETAIRYSAAESLYAEATTALEDATNSPERLVAAYADLAAVRIRLCRYDQAQEAYDRALLIATTTLGAENVTVASVMNGLGRIELYRGHYGNAERLFLRALSMAEKAGGPNHPAVAEVLRGLAEVCRAERRFVEGVKYASRAIQIHDINKSSTAEEVALCNVMLGYNLRGHGYYDTALACYLSAQSIAEAAYGTYHPVRAFIYNHRALLNCNLYKQDSAIVNADSARMIAETIFGEHHVETGTAEYVLGRAYTLKDQPEQALPHLARAVAILKPLLGEKHPLMDDVLGMQSSSYRYLERFDDAMRLAHTVAVNRLEGYIENTSHLEDRLSATYSSGTYYSVSGYPAYYFDAPSVTAEQSRILATLAISNKGIVNEDLFRRRRALERATDPKIRELYEEVRLIRSEKSALQFTDPNSLDSTTKIVTDSLSRREMDILSIISESDDITAGPRLDAIVNLEDIFARIPENACLVEYYGFHYEAPDTVNIEGTHFAAVVLDRNGIRGHQSLGNLNESLMPTAKPYLAGIQKRAESSEWTGEDWKVFYQHSRGFYDRIWAPIAGLVGDDKFVIVASDFLISQISLAALLAPDGTWLAEKHAFQYVSSARELLRYNSPATSGHGLFALFDPDYDASVNARRTAVTEDPEWSEVLAGHPFAVRNIRPSCEQLDNLKLERLPNTRPEIEIVTQDWQKAMGGPVRKYDGARATEEMIKHVAPSHRVLHVATHGYFVEVECRTRDQLHGYFYFEPMLFSGLLLAGANLGGRGANESGMEDGILTAYEVSGLNLDGTNLVVLSACQTGRGDVSMSQGPFGISRAFRLAGARQVVSALWPVSDAASIGAMAKIYGSPDKTVAEALQDFAIEQINADRTAGRQTDPFTWAPYISYGDWRAR